MNWIKLSALILVIASTSVACKSKNSDTTSKNKSNPPVIVDVMIASTSTLDKTVEANGTAIANEYVELHPEVSGRLIYLNVKEGSHVQQGTVIARVNDADLKAQLEKIKVQLDLAQKTEARYKQLLSVNGLNESDYDVALNQVNGYKADIAYTQALIDKTVVKAPFSGVVGLRQVSPGAYVTPATVIATIQQTDQIKIDFTLPENYASIVKRGSTVKIKADNISENLQRATIAAVEPQVDQSTRNLKVRAILHGGSINLGAFVKVYIEAAAHRNAIMVPTGCIIPDDKNKQLVLVKNGKATFVNVTTGDRQADDVAITSGVNAGDTIVVTGVLFAKPNAPLKVRSIK